jgi:hypothetical protein
MVKKPSHATVPLKTGTMTSVRPILVTIAQLMQREWPLLLLMILHVETSDLLSILYICTLQS